MFITHWHFGFAVNENDRLSLQFFDADGSAVHKIYLTDKSDLEAYQRLVAKYSAEEQNQQLMIQATPQNGVEKPDHEVAVNAFQEAWIALQDTHDFHGLLKDYGLTRTGLCGLHLMAMPNRSAYHL